MSQCQYQRVGGYEGAWDHQCKACGHIWTASESDPARLHHPCDKSSHKSITTIGRGGARQGPCPESKPTSDDPKCTCQIREATRRWLEAGKPNPDQALTSARLAVCQACEHWAKYHRLAMTIGLPTLQCPRGKWPMPTPCSPCLEPARTEAIMAGAPLRTPAEVTRLAAICKRCPEFGDGRVTTMLRFSTFTCVRQRFGA